MSQEILNNLWVEKYRPKCIEDYVFKNSALEVKVLDWISSGVIPMMLIHGPAGTGKTSLIHVMLNSMPNINEDDVMELNFSDEGMDAVREKILPFCQTSPYGDYKVIILEEFEQCSHKGQGSLKRIMEEYSDNCRFILTSNAPNRILPPIRSRCQEVAIEKHNTDQFTMRLLQILVTEDVQVDSTEALELVDKYVKACWPDFRKAINTLQAHVVNGSLIELNDSSSSGSSYETAIIESIKTNTLSATRKSIVQNITEDMIDGFFSWLYQNVEIWIPQHLSATDVDKMTMALILAIREGCIKDTLCADREMNLSATLVQLQMVQSEFL